MARYNTSILLFRRLFLQISFLLKILISTSGQSTEINYMQSYSVFTEDNCKGENETFFHSVTNLEDRNISKLGHLGLIKSRSVQRGVWVEIHKPNTNKAIVSDGNMGSLCLNSKSTLGTYNQIKSIRRAGATDLRLPALSLFTDPNFEGDKLYFEGLSLRLPYAFTFWSWGSTGGVGWTLYKPTNVDRQLTCLVPFIDDSVYYYHVDYEVSMTLSLQVESLYRGCWTLLQPPPDEKEMTDIPGIIFFDLKQKESVFTNGRDLVLPFPVYIKSYTFTGRLAQNWTIYETTDGNLHYKCIHNLVNASTPREHVLIYEPRVIELRRVRSGCDDDPRQLDRDVNSHTTKRTNSGAKRGSKKTFKFWIFLLHFVQYTLNLSLSR